MVFANGFSPVEDFPKAMTQIKEYLANCIVEDKFENVNTVRVYFTVNSDGEIVILDVSTKDNEVSFTSVMVSFVIGGRILLITCGNIILKKV